MTTDDRLRSRVLRRELHSPRSGTAIPLALAAIVALAWVGAEAVLAALGRPALLLTPRAMAAGIRGLPGVQPGTLIAAGAVLVLIGLVLVVLALAPGRRGRHVVGTGVDAVVVDDAVIASALVRTAASTAGVSPDRCVAHVGRRSATVRVTPVSGVPVDRDAVQRDVQASTEGFGLTPPVRARLVIDRHGKVGG